MAKLNIIIHDMGRVGSQSIFLYLSKRYKKIMNTHYLSEKMIKIKEEECLQFKSLKFNKWHRNMNLKYIDSKCFSQKILEKREQNIRFKVISPVREPMGFFVSNVFGKGTIKYYFQYLKFSNIKYDNKISVMRKMLEEWVNHFINEKKSDDIILNHYFSRCNYPDLFMKYEIEQFWDIDWKKYDFSRPYIIGKEKYCDILFIKNEKMKKYLKKSLKKFLGKPMGKVNWDKNCSVRELRDIVLKDYIFPPEFIDKIYSLDYVKYIYSKKEIENFKKKWQKK
jgi:hypothetical protein